uniref:Uncharacterized protein n=1 Tax=Anguilla anguilla TaxID=7936 RepID=A0A0E9WL48_ANGAN
MFLSISAIKQLHVQIALRRWEYFFLFKNKAFIPVLVSQIAISSLK